MDGDNSTKATEFADILEFNCKHDLVWIAVEAVTASMALIQLYLITVLIYFVWIVKTLKPCRIRTGEEKFGEVFGRLLLASAVLGFIRIALNIDFIWMHHGIPYTALKIGKYVSTTAAITTLYSVLWLRQKVLYSHRMTDHVNSKYVRCLVWCALILLILVAILNGTFFIYPDTYAASPFECLFHEGQSEYVFVKWIVLLLSMGFFQILLLTLFIYPLAMQRKSFETSTKQARANNVYKNVIMRVIYSTIACMITDLAATVAVLAQRDSVDHDTTDFYFDVSLFVNQMSIFYSFGDWKAKLFPWLPSSRKLRQQQRRGNTSRQSKYLGNMSKASVKSQSRLSLRASVRSNSGGCQNEVHNGDASVVRTESS